MNNKKLIFIISILILALVISFSQLESRSQNNPIIGIQKNKIDYSLIKKPVIIVLIEEKIKKDTYKKNGPKETRIITNLPGSTETEKYINKKLTDAGFKIVPLSDVAKAVKSNPELIEKAREGWFTKEVVDLVYNKIGADVVISGSLNIRRSYAIRIGMYKIFDSRIKIKAYSVKSQRVLSSGRWRGTGKNIDSDLAFKQAIEKCAKRFITSPLDGSLKEHLFWRRLLEKYWREEYE